MKNIYRWKKMIWDIEQTVVEPGPGDPGRLPRLLCGCNYTKELEKSHMTHHKDGC